MISGKSKFYIRQCNLFNSPKTSYNLSVYLRFHAFAKKSDLKLECGSDDGEFCSFLGCVPEKTQLMYWRKIEHSQEWERKEASNLKYYLKIPLNGRSWLGEMVRQIASSNSVPGLENRTGEQDENYTGERDEDCGSSKRSQTDSSVKKQ